MKNLLLVVLFFSSTFLHGQLVRLSDCSCTGPVASINLPPIKGPILDPPKPSFPKLDPVKVKLPPVDWGLVFYHVGNGFDFVIGGTFRLIFNLAGQIKFPKKNKVKIPKEQITFEEISTPEIQLSGIPSKEITQQEYSRPKRIVSKPKRINLPKVKRTKALGRKPRCPKF